MKEVVLVAKNVQIGYGKFSVSNIRFRLRNGDILGLVGRSGAGKSTVIKALINLNKPKSGTIDAYVNNEREDIRKVIGYSSQDNALFPYLTLKENLITFGKLHKIKKSEILNRMDYLLKRLNLDKSANKRISQLSGGMEKRADLAVTLIHDPEIIVLDEPFNGLDISLQMFIWELMKELARKGRIIIISSHMLSDLQKNCSQFGLIENGAYYDHKQIIEYLKVNKTGDIQRFLQKLFSYDYSKGESN